MFFGIEKKIRIFNLKLKKKNQIMRIQSISDTSHLQEQI